MAPSFGESMCVYIYPDFIHVHQSPSHSYFQWLVGSLFLIVLNCQTAKSHEIATPPTTRFICRAAFQVAALGILPMAIALTDLLLDGWVGKCTENPNGFHHWNWRGPENVPFNYQSQLKSLNEEPACTTHRLKKVLSICQSLHHLRSATANVRAPTE